MTWFQKPHKAPFIVPNGTVRLKLEPYFVIYKDMVPYDTQKDCFKEPFLGSVNELLSSFLHYMGYTKNHCDDDSWNLWVLSKNL